MYAHNYMKIFTSVDIESKVHVQYKLEVNNEKRVQISKEDRLIKNHV